MFNETEKKQLIAVPKSCKMTGHQMQPMNVDRKVRKGGLKKKKERVNVEKNKSVWGGVMKWDVEKQGSVNNTDGKVARKERRRQTKGS